MPLYRGSRRLILRRNVVAGGTTTFDPSNLGTSQVLSLGNLKDSGSGTDGIAHSVASHSTGKYYYEITVGAMVNGGFGIMSAGASVNTFISSPNYGGTAFNSTTYQGSFTGTTTVPATAAGHVFGVAVDLTNRTMWIKDITAAGNWNANGTADPATNTNGAIMGGNLATGNITAMASCGNGADNVTANFGATAYVGTPPSGFGNW